MKMLGVLVLLSGCAEATQPPPVDPQLVYREAQIDAWCARPDLDQQQRDWCFARSMYQQRMAAQAQADREAAADDRQRRRERAEAIDRAFAPWRQPLPPIAAPVRTPPRTCTSLVNGQIITTNCF